MFGYASSSLATEAVARARMLAPVPPGMAAATAASLPIAFLTALYGLKRIAGLKEGQSVLIHAAAGGVGLAAVQIAQRQGAEIFATVGSEEKRQLLIRQGVRNVLNSRSLDFADQILALTQNRGVDVVLQFAGGRFYSSRFTFARQRRLLPGTRQEGNLVPGGGGVAAPRCSVCRVRSWRRDRKGSEPLQQHGERAHCYVVRKGSSSAPSRHSDPARAGPRRHAFHGASAARRPNRPHDESGQGRTPCRGWLGMGPLDYRRQALWARKPRGGSRAAARAIWF